MKNRHRDFSTSSKSRQLRFFFDPTIHSPPKKIEHTNHQLSYRSRFSTHYTHSVSHVLDQQQTHTELTGKKVGKQPIRELKTINRAFQFLRGAKTRLPFQSRRTHTKRFTYTRTEVFLRLPVSCVRIFTIFPITDRH